jgi:hypothetical protein
MPTVEQSIMSVLLCHSLSNFFRDITLFRFDVSKQEIFILTSDDLQIVINSQGKWRFV